MTTPAYTAQQTADGNMVTYERVEFDKYSPTTLLDILERIPGIQDVIDQGNDGRRNNQRGFGSAGEQILINGKRLSAKTTSIRDILARTSASEVERVELIRGAADGLDVQTEGLLINVILSEIASTSSTFWKVVGTYMVGEKVNPLFELSHKGSAGNLDYTLVLEGERKQGYFTRDEIFYDENGLRTGEKDMDGSYRFRELTPSANLTYTFNNKSVLNLNGSYKPIFVQNDQIHIETGDDAETLFWDFEEDFFIWEVGGDYSITLGSLGKLKTLFLMNREYNADFLTDRFDGTGSQQYLYNKEIIDFQKHEDIFRTSLTRDLTPKQSLEVGGEASFNTIKQLFLNYERDIAVDPLELTTRNDIEVSEKRFEIFAHHNYTFSEKAVLQSSLTTEFSKITANTFLVDNPDIIVENNFTFFKPRFNFRYDLTKSDQYRLVAEKKISQLEFFHYFTFFDQQTKEIRKGNNDIKPEQIWEFSATYEHRLPNDAGTLEIKAFYH
ncbi:MAG: TonB-dependent receptor, partial [Emcibacteraceae bacterium]|nr:TonB-dependent receptor [Emcibacteraceae bacterium]